MRVSIDKKYQTRDGQQVKLKLIEPDFIYGVCGEVTNSKGETDAVLWWWTHEGDYFRFTSHSPLDLVEITEH